MSVSLWEKDCDCVQAEVVKVRDSWEITVGFGLVLLLIKGGCCVIQEIPTGNERRNF